MPAWAAHNTRCFYNLQAASAIKSLCLSVPPPPPLCPLFARILCDNIGGRASVRHAKFPCNQQLLLLLPPSPLAGVFQANYTITTTRQACFLDRGSRGGSGACRTSKCHEKGMSCCCRCCCCKCRQRLIISNWVNGSNSSSSISLASGSGGGRGTVWFDKATSVDRILGPLM